MNSKKIIHELTDEDLAALAGGAKVSTIASKLSEAALFIRDIKVKHGDEKISAQLVYYTYKNWRGKDSETKPLFLRDFKNYFTPQRSANGLVFLLNPKPFDLSPECFWAMRAELRQEKARRERQQKK